jgi:hypothetical protein
MSVLGYLCGLDLGQAQDYTALAVAEVHARAHEYLYYVRHLQRFGLKTSYPAIVRHVAALLQHPPVRGQTTLIADATGVGQPVIEMLKEAGLNPIAITITSGNVVTEHAWNAFHVPKRDLVSAIQIPLQSRRLSIAPRFQKPTSSSKSSRISKSKSRRPPMMSMAPGVKAHMMTWCSPWPSLSGTVRSNEPGDYGITV